MPYNNMFPMGYQPYYPQVQQQMAQPQMQQPQAPVQNNGFVRVQSENDARMYPVAPGNSITFIDDNAPYCYVKTMDFSQLDRPKFEKYRLVKEEEIEAQTVPKVDMNNYATKDDLAEVWTVVKALQGRGIKHESADDE